MQKLPAELIRARTCYKHLAGELGVAITRALARRGCIRESAGQQCFTMTPKGRLWCERHGVNAYLNGRSESAKACMDHSHRTPHIAGDLGRALLSFMQARDYCYTESHRRVSVTAHGAAFLRAELGINWAQSGAVAGKSTAG